MLRFNFLHLPRMGSYFMRVVRKFIEFPTVHLSIRLIYLLPVCLSRVRCISVYPNVIKFCFPIFFCTFLSSWIQKLYLSAITRGHFLKGVSDWSKTRCQSQKNVIVKLWYIFLKVAENRHIFHFFKGFYNVIKEKKIHGVWRWYTRLKAFYKSITKFTKHT